MELISETLGDNMYLEYYLDEDGKFLGGNCIRRELQDNYRVIEFNRELIIDLFNIILVANFDLNKYSIKYLQRTNVGRQITSSEERDLPQEKNIKNLIKKLMSNLA